MVLRSARCAAAAALVVVGVLLCAAGDDASSAAGSASLVLLNETPTVLPASPGQPAPFQVTVRVSGAPAGAELALVVYDKLHSRSAFEQSLTSGPSHLLQDVAPAPLSTLRAVGPGVQYVANVEGGTAESDGAGTIGLPCTVGNGTCSGVYPVEVELLDQGGSELAHFTTYLVYAEVRSAHPLVFSWIEPLGAPVRIRAGAPLAGALPMLSPARVRDFAFLTGDLAGNPGVQVTVAPSPATVQRLEADRSTPARTTIAELRALGDAGPGRLIAQPYVPVNLASLSAAGVAEEIAGQTETEASIMAPVTGTLPLADQPSFSTWVADGPVSPAIEKGLAQLHSDSLVLEDTDLPFAAELDHATWAQSFDLELGRTTIAAAAIDSQLSSLFTATPGDPALAANHLLAELAMIQSELPGAADARGVIAMPPASWDPNAKFVTALVSGLAGNPVITTATLRGFFSAVPVGGNAAETTRRLSSAVTPEHISAAQAADIVRARNQLDAFSASVVGSPAVESQLGDLLLASESSMLKTSGQQAGLAAFDRQLHGELASIKVVANTVTLTAQTASIPITITSSAAFQMNAVLTLSSAKLVFPQGSTRTVHVDHPTNSVQVEVRARTSGDLPLEFSLRSPDGGLVIDHGTLTVRSTATSIVGIVLTLVAAVVLVGWWARTWARARRSRRQPRPG